ncbi:MAG TPA: tRNA guanosine(34) transglycosylase Tgt [Candidatus Paceibacterota bacterium]|nr:tRNA guanosine(34) transglycosylase Tgt [Candidatus Paceibacterota bacterium]
MKEIKIRGRKMQLPAFLPDATFGKIKGIDDSEDLVKCKLDGLVVNTYHLFKENLIHGNKGIKQSGGIHNFMNLNDKIIISDSGGFQVMSIIHTNSKNGKINDDGAVFLLDGKKVELTPEKCIQFQLDIGSDIVMCLDDCTYPDMSNEEQEISVKRTIDWAKRCRKEFDKLTKNIEEGDKPFIFGIIQGGNNLELRKKCADKLIDIGFDGYAFGGWPAEDGKFLHSILKYTCELMPENKLKYAMGVGKPEDIFYCVSIGYNMFDCVIPTREARNNRLYAFKKNIFGKMKKIKERNNFYEYVRIRNSNYIGDKKLISKFCDCECCTKYSRSDIYKLFKEKNRESVRLATMHNLRFYSMLMERLRNIY